MLGAALIILKILGAAAAFALFTVLFSPFMLSSRISREEEDAEYKALVERLQRAHDAKSAQAANDHGAPIDLVRS